jgi:hypothetical protein
MSGVQGSENRGQRGKAGSVEVQRGGGEKKGLMTHNISEKQRDLGVNHVLA